MSSSDSLLQLCFETSAGWRQWLEQNHSLKTEAWLVFYKKETGIPTLDYNSAVEEALCFGWIDSIIRRIDEEKYMRKFTPRKAGAVWSPSNLNRVKKLMEEGRMAAPGLQKVEAAKKAGLFKPHQPPVLDFTAPAEFLEALEREPEAKKYFNTLSMSHQKEYIGWIITAKREETRIKRIRESVSMLNQGRKLGLK